MLDIMVFTVKILSTSLFQIKKKYCKNTSLTEILYGWEISWRSSIFKKVIKGNWSYHYYIYKVSSKNNVYMLLYWTVPTNFRKSNTLVTYNLTFYITYIIRKGEKANGGVGGNWEKWIRSNKCTWMGLRKMNKIFILICRENLQN